jgi:hypothetical protein
MKVGVLLLWKNKDHPNRPPVQTARLYVEAKTDRQVFSAAKRLQDSYGADDYTITD